MECSGFGQIARNTAARNAVMFGLIEFVILHSPYWGRAALGVCNILLPLFSYLIQRERETERQRERKYFQSFCSGFWGLRLCFLSVFN